MESLSNYIKVIITVVFFYTVISMLLPEGDMKKYCRFAAGIIVTICLLSPLSEFKNFALDDINIEDIPYTTESYNNEIARVFKEKIKREIKDRFNAEVEIEIDENFNITGVKTDSPHKDKIEKYLGLTQDGY